MSRCIADPCDQVFQILVVNEEIVNICDKQPLSIMRFVKQENQIGFIRLIWDTSECILARL